LDSIDVSLPKTGLKRQRLYEDKDFSPWVPAQSELEGTRLFWIPVSAFPLSHREKVWITEFLRRMGEVLSRDFGLRTEIFLQYKQITPEMGDSFRKYAQKCMKLLGLGRSSKNDLPSFPTQDQVKEAVDSGKPFDFRDWLGNYTIWFTSKQPEEQRELFLGCGGMTTIFLPPDPKLKPLRLPFTPKLRASFPVFQRTDVDGIITGTLAMQDAFLEKSKKLFGEDLVETPEYPGLAFILPLLDANHFFLANAETRSQWFELFDVYVNESRKDKGLVLAFQKEEYDQVMLDVLESMERDGLKYEVPA